MAQGKQSLSSWLPEHYDSSPKNKFPGHLSLVWCTEALLKQILYYCTIDPAKDSILLIPETLSSYLSYGPDIKYLASS